MTLGSAPRTDESRLLELDVFRAIAILGVLVHHFLSRYALPDHDPSLYGYRYSYPHWLDLGAMGVQFFFIISGFVIFMTLERCESLFEFWVRRVARLYPAFAVATFMTFATVNTLGPPEFHARLLDALAGLTFLPGYIPNVKFVEPAYWSLVVELQFYCCIGIVYSLARGRFVASWTAYCAAGTALSILGSIPHWHMVGTLARHVFLAVYVPYFTIGIAFYQVSMGYRRGWWVLALTAVIQYAVTTPLTTPAQHLTSVAMVLAFIGFVSGKLKFLAVRPLVFVGGISYSLYLLHQYIGVSLIPYFTRGLGLPDIVAVCCVTAICVALAYLLMRYVEVPAKRAILRWYFRPRSERVPAQAGAA